MPVRYGGAVCIPELAVLVVDVVDFVFSGLVLVGATDTRGLDDGDRLCSVGDEDGDVAELHYCGGGDGQFGIVNKIYAM
jgi:hypothetical protein